MVDSFSGGTYIAKSWACLDSTMSVIARPASWWFAIHPALQLVGSPVLFWATIAAVSAKLLWLDPNCLCPLLLILSPGLFCFVFSEAHGFIRCVRDLLRWKDAAAGAGMEDSKPLHVVIVPFVFGKGGLNTYWVTILCLALELTEYRGNLPEQWGRSLQSTVWILLTTVVWSFFLSEPWGYLFTIHISRKA